MSKKTKNPKPLPSALSVASPARFAAETAEVGASPRLDPPERLTPKTTAAKPKKKAADKRLPVVTAPDRNTKSTPPDAETVPLSPPPSPAAKSTKVIFSYLDPHAREVFVCGDFNNWLEGALPMSRQADGRWETSTALSQGRYQYKFVVDGQWLPDPTCQETVLNDHGTLNSVLVV